MKRRPMAEPNTYARGFEVGAESGYRDGILGGMCIGFVGACIVYVAIRVGIALAGGPLL